MNRTIAALLALSAGMGCAMGGCAAAEKPSPASALHPLVGEPVPEVHQAAIDGGTVDVPLAGAKVTIVDFFASWCEPCAKSLPELDAFVTEHEKDGVRLVLVSLDEDPNVAGAFLDRLGVKRPATVDPKLAIAKRFKVEKLPMTFVVGASGKIAWSGKHFVGAQDATLAELGQPATPVAPATPPSAEPASERPLQLKPSMR